MITFPNKNINSVKNAVAPKMSPVIPPRAFLDFLPIIKIIANIKIVPNIIPLIGKKNNAGKIPNA